MKWLMVGVCSIVLAIIWNSGAAVAATVPSMDCTNLSATLSSDKNYYLLSATGTAPTSTTIAGYSFDFGDHETYTFNFDAITTKDHSHATIHHTYEEPGRYLATAYTLNDSGVRVGKGCSTTINIGAQAQPVSNLVDTGPTWSMWLIIVTMICLGYSGATIWLHLKQRATIR